MTRHEIGSQHGHEAEEQEYIEVPEPAVTVRVAAEGIFHRTHDGAGAQQEHQDGRQIPQRAEGLERHRRSGDDAKDDEDADEHLHFTDGEHAAVQSVLRSLTVFRVGPVEDVAQFVREVRQDLEADGGEDDEDGHPDIDLEVGRGEEDAQDGSARGKGQGAKPHGGDGGAELIHK